jgi:hypothetical protein
VFANRTVRAVRREERLRCRSDADPFFQPSLRLAATGKDQAEALVGVLRKNSVKALDDAVLRNVPEPQLAASKSISRPGHEGDGRGYRHDQGIPRRCASAQVRRSAGGGNREVGRDDYEDAARRRWRLRNVSAMVVSTWGCATHTAPGIARCSSGVPQRAGAAPARARGRPEAPVGEGRRAENK